MRYITEIVRKKSEFIREDLESFLNNDKHLNYRLVQILDGEFHYTILWEKKVVPFQYSRE